MEELTDILVGLEQRINAYKSRFQELEKKRRRLDDEIATIKKYLELAETLYRVEADKAKLASLSNQFIQRMIPKGFDLDRIRTSPTSRGKFLSAEANTWGKASRKLRTKCFVSRIVRCTRRNWCSV